MNSKSATFSVFINNVAESTIITETYSLRISQKQQERSNNLTPSNNSNEPFTSKHVSQLSILCLNI